MLPTAYIAQSSSVLRQTFSRVWGRRFDITWWETGAGTSRRYIHLLHPEGVPAVDVAVEADHHDLLGQDVIAGQQ